MPKEPQVPATEESTEQHCGIIMPIAAMPNYDEEHWATVLELVTRAITCSGMLAAPVWARGPADVLQERIVRNLFEQPYAVCDISGQNPNVMLELGIRLAFGKPTIIINDQEMRAPFDIGAIEYVPYHRGLKILQAENFVERLATKIGTVRQSIEEKTYKAFIKTFGPIEFGTPGEESIPVGRAVLDQLEELSTAVRLLGQAKRFDPVRAAAEGYADQFNSGLKIRAALGTRLGQMVPISVDPSQIHLVTAKLSILPGVADIISNGPGDLLVSLDGGLSSEHQRQTSTDVMRIANDHLPK